MHPTEARRQVERHPKRALYWRETNSPKRPGGGATAPPTKTSPAHHQGSTTYPEGRSLTLTLGDRTVLSYRQLPNLKQLLTSNHTLYNKNTNPGTKPYNKPRCQLCPHIYSRDTIIGPNHISHTIKGLFTCTSTNVIYAIMCQQCPSTMYIVQTGQSLRKRINGHKSDIRNHNIQKPIGEHFNLSGHSITDLKVAILQPKKTFKNSLQCETAELELICKLDTIRLSLNKDWEWLSYYKT
ncbi:uncharacterized protein LOC128837434 [Malaclemys terrapin pileata]|uniref:uncharacterized protein LOC128837434 n=1 Tax=Malaclemys terrapin pileata TaxID=2991368 RepID=UPI0023A83F46|nr:uncharacterized protein LOC128837434 [Malaclemys terrapin pileata]